MTFFDQPPEPEPEPVPRRVYHPWDPSETEFPGIVQIDTLQFQRSERAAIAITGISAYTAGLEIFVTRRVRPGIPESSEALSHARWHLPAGRESFQIGLRLSGGRKVISRQHRPGFEPTGPILEGQFLRTGIGMSVRLLSPGTPDCVEPGQECPLRAG